MTRPTRAATLYTVAQAYAMRSTCSRLAVGAVIARQGRILATGYNGPPAGMDHCTHDTGAYTIRGDQPCLTAVHAEANAVAFSARHGVATESCEMYVTHAPCRTCSKLIINAGIIRVFYLEEFRDMTGVDLLEQANVETFCGLP